MYLRISNDDIEKPEDKDSASIVNQRHLLLDYLDTHPEFDGWERIELCDDGWSGTTFDRPGMKKLLDLVRKGCIHCIIVKDLSRFGRNYLASGDYITRVFPFLGVRFISLGDGYDSARPQDLDSLSVPFSTILYDLYSRELSEKVRDAKDRLARKGDFLSTAAPFGYTMDPNQAKHLAVDPVTGETVRFIFDLVCEGHGSREIAQRLNQQKVLTPMLYKGRQGGAWQPWSHITEENYWTASMVTRIIRDERYTGCTIYGKRRRDMARKRTVKVPRNQWIITEGTHEALVSKERFREAQSKLRKYRERPETGTTAPLARRVYCGCCGRAMARSPGNTIRYFCKTQKFTDRFSCEKETIPEQEVIHAALESLYVQIRLFVDSDVLLIQQREQKKKTGKQLQRELSELQNRKKQTERGLQILYEQYADGKAGKEEYLAQKRILSRQLEALTGSIKKLAEDSGKEHGEEYIGWDGLDTLAKENLRRLVGRITIYPGNVLDVCFAFSDEQKATNECVEICQGENGTE